MYCIICISPIFWSFSGIFFLLKCINDVKSDCYTRSSFENVALLKYNGLSGETSNQNSKIEVIQEVIHMNWLSFHNSSFQPLHKAGYVTRIDSCIYVSCLNSPTLTNVINVSVPFQTPRSWILRNPLAGNFGNSSYSILNTSCNQLRKRQELANSLHVFAVVVRVVLNVKPSLFFVSSHLLIIHAIPFIKWIQSFDSRNEITIFNSLSAWLFMEYKSFHLWI
ncbi:Hypothetical_protein [Hexamita inflata]|uniref:Hypothetical_protein n=1 Tax=Hexamita inflata TaxID=28002 RepID=A0AA86QF08_9EUKA|nr:Hypothetical protein HINF_LOCUS41438 [Hexamita inflata]